jgi:hypothetical protein
MHPDTDFFRVKIGGLYGYINRQGKIVCPPRFKWASNFSESLAKVSIEDKEGFIDVDFNVVILEDFKNVYPFSGSRAVVQNKADQYGVIDKDGRMVVPFGRFSRIISFNEGLSAFEEVAANGETKTGFINLDGDVVLPAKYLSASSFSEGVSVVMIPGGEYGRYGGINPSGEFVIEPKFSQLGYFSDGLAIACVDSLKGAGFIDHSGAFVIEPQFRCISPFSEGLAQFENAAGIGFIDTTGKTVIQPRLEIAVANDFREGRLLFWTDTELNWSGYLDRTGAVAIPVQFIEAFDFKNGLALVTFGKEDGDEDDVYEAYIDRDGKVIWREDP